MSIETDRAIALNALRNRVENLADCIVRTDTARRHLAIAFQAVTEAGGTQDDVDMQVKIACKDRPDRQAALEHAGLIGEPAER